MRREKLETISSHAAPTPARHRLTNSAPSDVAKTFAAPTFKSLRSLRPQPSLRAPRARWKTSLPSADYDAREANVPENIGRKPTGRARPRSVPSGLSRHLTLLASCAPVSKYCSLAGPHYILW